MPKFNNNSKGANNRSYDVPGQTPATIAQHFGVSKSTVTRLRQKYLQTNDVDLPRSVRPRVTSEREIDLLYSFVYLTPKKERNF